MSWFLRHRERETTQARTQSSAIDQYPDSLIFVYSAAGPGSAGDGGPMVDCVVIVVSYRSARDVKDLLSTIPQAVGSLSWRAVVVNNDEGDDLAPTVAEHPEAEVVEAGANLGYAGGINLGRSAAPPSTWTVFLNPDLTLGPESIAQLVAEVGAHHAAVPLIRNDAGELQPSLRREPSVLRSLGDALLGNRWPGRPAFLSETVRMPAVYEVPGAVDWATGAALVVPTALADAVGRWDQDTFFLYSEETDYCRRLRAAGAQIRFVPEAVVRHQGAGSGSSDALHALLEVNRVRYYRKWHGVLTATAFAAVVVLNNLLRSHRARSRAALRALVSPTTRAALPGGAR